LKMRIVIWGTEVVDGVGLGLIDSLVGAGIPVMMPLVIRVVTGTRVEDTLGLISFSTSWTLSQLPTTAVRFESPK
jgi:homoserine dehydrogenase